MTTRYMPELDSYVICNAKGRPVRLAGLPLTFASKGLARDAIRFSAR